MLLEVDNMRLFSWRIVAYEHFVLDSGKERLLARKAEFKAEDYFIMDLKGDSHLPRFPFL